MDLQLLVPLVIFAFLGYAFILKNFPELLPKKRRKQ